MKRYTNRLMLLIDSFCNIVIRTIKDNFILFVFFYFVGISLTILPVIVLHTKLLRISFFTWISDIFIICIFLQLFHQNIKKCITVLIAILFYALAIVDVFCLITHFTNFNPEILNLILDTNNREANEYLSQYLKLELLFSPIGLILIISFLHLLACCDKKFMKFQVSKIHINGFSKTIITILIVVSMALSFPFRISFIKLLNAKSIFEIDNYVSYQAINTPFHNLLFGLKLRSLEKEELGKLAKEQQNVQIDTCTFNTPEIVFVIGESYIKSHSQLYGYIKETTPLQIQRAIGDKYGELITFDNVITPSNYTSTVFKNIFSLKSIDEKKPWGKASLFPTLFRKAGYHVAFITSQFVKDSKRDFFDFTGGLFLNNDDISSLAFDCRNDKDLRYDETLLEYYDSLKAYSKDYNLTIFHLIGQHIDFYKRSPEEWKRFQIKDYQERKDVSEKEKAYIADYDNATLYNDYVVNEIIKRFENKKAVVIYMPDHGEGCYDGGHRLGRMPNGEYTKNILQNEYDIPFWIWYSKLYQTDHPQICQQIRDARNRPFMTDDIPHLLLYLGGIKCHEYQEKKNLISPSYDIHRKRLLDGIVDYDSIISK